MKASVIITAIALLMTSSAFAYSITASVDLTISGGTGLYEANATLTFSDTDSDVTDVVFAQDVSGTDNWGFDWDHTGIYKPSPSGGSVDVPSSNTYDVVGDSGCDTPSVTATAADGASASATGTMVCWQATTVGTCNLSVYENTDGYISETGDSGSYPCNFCGSITASPNDGYDWQGWTGDFSTYDMTVYFCMNGFDRTLTANFTKSIDPGGGGCDPDTDPDCECDPFTGICNLVDPIVIDLANGAWSLTGKGDPVAFDMAGHGQKRLMGWTARGSDLAFLALDRNGNGTIDNGLELFSNTVVLMSGKRAHDGIEALAQYDANGDGVIDSADPIWKSLLLWVDRNHDGVSQADELIPITSSKITAIHLDKVWTGRRDSSGNYFRYAAHVQFGSEVRTFYDIFFVPVK